MNISEQLQRTKQASRLLVNISEEKINEVLLSLAEETTKRSEEILQANKKDLEKMDKQDPKYDRLQLTEERLQAIAGDMKNIARLPYPVGNILEEKTLENGLELKKVSVPLGVIGVIYEARPNVTFDVFSLCFKSGNSCVLKGGSDAKNSNQQIIKLIHEILEKHGVDQNVVTLISGREEAAELMNAVECVDVIIPRGSQNLIDFVRENSKVPVIETGAGIVHTYVDKSADIEMAANIVFNAKTRRPSVCNALDTLVIHEDLLDNLEKIIFKFSNFQIFIYADEKSYDILKGKYPDELLEHAKEEHFGTEFLSLKMSIKTVGSVEEAVEHITKHSSKHSEAIVAEDKKAIDYFLKNVDAACLYVNASTAFTDGAQFGLGAEIGISTQKLHARGPMALKGLTSYKWIVRGKGQIRA